MRKFYFLVLLLFVITITNAQSLRKVSGIQYIGGSYGIQQNGFNANLNFDNYFKKNFAYTVQLSLENTKPDNFSNLNIYLSGGLKNFISLSINNLYIGGGYGSFFGKQYAKHNILNDKSEAWIWGLYLNPTIEYYVINNISISLSYTQYFDFNNNFRNYHYSINLGVSYSF